MAAGIALWQFSFRLYEEAMGKQEVRDSCSISGSRSTGRCD
jgi:hypothetical protein